MVRLFFAAILGAAAAVAPAAAQSADEASSAACDTNGADAVGRLGCYARVLGATERDLSNEVDALRRSARGIETPDRRRAALAAIDGAHNSWRLLRDHDCALRAALEADPAQASLVQMDCAIRRTTARIEDLTVIAATTPAEPREAGAPADAEPVLASAERDAEAPEEVAPPIVASDTFRDWSAACDETGACHAAAETIGAASNAPRHAILVERANAQEDWRVRLTTADGPAVAPITVSIDGLAPIVFQPSGGYAAPEGGGVTFMAPLKTAAMFAGMRAGLEMTAAFTDASGETRTERFSLRGLTAALDWIEMEQDPQLN